MEYRASDAGEVIDQRKLSVSVNTIFGGKGNDTIIFGNANVHGGAGNDVFQFLGGYGAVVYWESPTGIQVDLSNGTARDGYGSVDTLNGVMSVHGSGHSDTIIGNSGDNGFFGNGGSDTVTGGGGNDIFTYFGAKSTDATITYNMANDSFTVAKKFANGDRGVDTLTGISRIAFVGEGSDQITVERAAYVPANGFLRPAGPFSVNLPADSFMSQLKAGDFDGDGKPDLAILSQVGTGTAPGNFIFFKGKGDGVFSSMTKSLVPGGSLAINAGGRVLLDDFNNDKHDDIVVFNFGDDAPPFPGGLNSLFLSSLETGMLVDQSATLPRAPQLNHAGSSGDVNGDGYADLLVNTLSAGNQLYLNKGDGTFALRADLIPFSSTMLGGVAYARTNTQSGIIDVNADGYADIILGRWDNEFSAPASQVLLNDGKGDFTKMAPINLPGSGVSKEIILDVKAIDLNHDGRPDLMLSITNGGPQFYLTPFIQLLINDGGGRFHDETEARLPAAIQKQFGTGWIMELTNTDINRDGFDDILMTSASDTVASVLLMNQRDGTFRPTWSSGPGGRTVALDVNNDGMDDLLTYANGNAVADINVMGRIMTGTAASDTLRATRGNDKLDGGAGIDSVSYDGARTSFTIGRGNGGHVVTDKVNLHNVDQLVNIERIVFNDSVLALDIDGNGGQAYRLYQAAFNRTPDAGGVGFWISMMDRGASLASVAQGFVQAPEFVTVYGAQATNTEIINKFYSNVLQRPGEEGGIKFWAGVLDSKSATLAEVLAGFSESPENQANLIGTIGNGFSFQPFG